MFMFCIFCILCFSIIDSVICSNCPNGRYLVDAGTTTAAHEREDQCLFCIKGKQFKDKTSECTICEAGTYQNRNDATSAICSRLLKGFIRPRILLSALER